MFQRSCSGLPLSVNKDVSPLVVVLVDGDDHVVAGTSDGLEGPGRVVTRACAVGPRRWNEGPDRPSTVEGGLAQVSSPRAVRGGGRQLKGSGDGLGMAEEDAEKSAGQKAYILLNLRDSDILRAIGKKQLDYANSIIRGAHKAANVQQDLYD